MINGMKPVRIGIAGLAVATAMVFSQGSLAEQSPYADFSTRQIKALSADRVADLKAGKGAGYALAAELNGYPGPRHVLDLADKLDLTAEQRQQIQGLFHTMQQEARTLGAKLIAKEAVLDRLFAEGRADKAGIFASVGKIADVEAKLRATHLKYHLSMKAILTLDQMADYSRLRGYHDAAADGGGKHRSRGHGH